MYTSTGEVTLEEHLRRGSIELDAGLLLRFAHIPSDAGKGYGVFDCINYGTAPQDIGNRINELASQHYGHRRSWMWERSRIRQEPGKENRFLPRNGSGV